MKFIQKLSLIVAAVCALSVPAMAGVTVSSPTSGASVSTSFPLSASATSCSGVPVVSMGYSFDSTPNVMTKSGQTLDVEATITAGNHTLRVKAWGKGTTCVTEVALNVVKTAQLIPDYAISSGDLDGNSKWKCQHDSAASGSSSATMSYPLTINGYNDVQQFKLNSYSNHGGERCSVDFVNQTSAHNFVYDVYVQFPNPSQIANLELDMNEVTTTGYTYIFGFQCSTYSKTWEYTYTDSQTHWKPIAAAPCDPLKWTANAWHHVQIYSSRDDSNHITYHWVVLDGEKYDINVTVKSAEDLNWGIGDNVVNFQIDPKNSSGSNLVVYAHKLTIYRW